MRPETIFVLVFTLFLVSLITFFTIFVNKATLILIVIPIYIIVDYFIHKDDEWLMNHLKRSTIYWL